MNLRSAFGLVATLSVRNLLAHRMKSLIVGFLLGFGTFLVVTGSALLSSVENAMQGSVTHSLTGHLQVYSEDAEDDLAMFGGMSMSDPDVGEISSFAELERAISGVDNVASVVPMGLSLATVFGRNEIDVILNDLRNAVVLDDERSQRLLVGRVQTIVRSIQDEAASLELLVADAGKWKESGAVMDRVAADDYFSVFRLEALAEVDAMESHVAPTAKDGRLLYLRTLGTDTEQFAEVFDRFYIVDGTPIPSGKRGYLFSKRIYEELVKIKVARDFDDVFEAVTEDGRTIAEDTLLQEQVVRNARQYQRIVFHLDAEEAVLLESELRALMPKAVGDLEQLVKTFLTVSDETLERHYAFFYDVIGQMVPIYEVPIGGEITLRSYTRSGYQRAVSVPVYGTFHFRGLEDSEISGATNLTDLVTFRDLYGKMSDAQRAELDEIRAEVGLADVDRASAEDLLFGDEGLFDDTTETVELSAAASEWEDLTLDVERSTADEAFDPSVVRDGLVLNAAIMLEDPTRIEETRAELVKAFDAAGLPLQIVGWQEAAGMIGQFVIVVRIILIIALLVIFLVALVIINNSMVMATLDRTPEIGTMRAIGAQRGQVILLFLAETLMLGLMAGAAGLLASVVFVEWLGEVGIPAVLDALVMLFSGPRLYPSYDLGDLALGLVSVLSVSVLSTLYPALLAARVEPVVAMRGKE